VAGRRFFGRVDAIILLFIWLGLARGSDMCCAVL
jgi:hypothetical protein